MSGAATICLFVFSGNNAFVAPLFTDPTYLKYTPFGHHKIYIASFGKGVCMSTSEQSPTHESFSRRGSLQAAPPSVKLVGFVLHYHGELTVQEIQNHSLLPKRTIRYALRHLREAELLEERISLQDARIPLYRLRDGA